MSLEQSIDKLTKVVERLVDTLSVKNNEQFKSAGTPILCSHALNEKPSEIKNDDELKEEVKQEKREISEKKKQIKESVSSKNEMEKTVPMPPVPPVPPVKVDNVQMSLEELNDALNDEITRLGGNPEPIWEVINSFGCSVSELDPSQYGELLEKVKSISK